MSDFESAIKDQYQDHLYVTAIPGEGDIGVQGFWGADKRQDQNDFCFTVKQAKRLRKALKKAIRKAEGR